MLRRFHTGFDPRKWLASVVPDRTALHRAVREYRKLSPPQQRAVRGVADGPLVESLKLHDLLSSAPPAQVFEHIASRVNVPVLAELTEQFLLRLLAAGNLNAVVSLVHVVLHADAHHYSLSTQFWSLLASQASETCHHAAATLVYHEIVNPYENYVAAGTVPAGFNEHVPFLLLPTAIEGLATVFARNGNSVAVEGLHAYFKRFYSYYGHRSTYEAILVAKVEALAHAGDLQGALAAYDELAAKYRGHAKYKDPKDVSHSLKYASHVNYKDREKRIEHNVSSDHISLDPGQASIADKHNLAPFQPDIVYNKYSIAGEARYAILDGSLQVEDLPTFLALLRQNIGILLREKHSVIDRVMNFITSHHHSLNRFVIACACDLGYCKEASAIMSRIPTVYHFYQKPNFSTADEFTRIFLAVRENLASDAPMPAEDYHKLLQQNFQLCLNLHLKRRGIPLNCVRAYVSAYLASPLAEKQEVQTILKHSGYWRTPKISLDENSYKRAQALGVDTLFLLHLLSFPCT